jgi:hypothetical protein
MCQIKYQMSTQISRGVLLGAVKIIKQWHDMPETDPEEMNFKIYYDHSPEMKDIRNALGTYEEIRDEAISANSISVALCTICRKSVVDASNGFDTCATCQERM